MKIDKPPIQGNVRPHTLYLDVDGTPEMRFLDPFQVIRPCVWELGHPLTVGIPDVWSRGGQRNCTGLSTDRTRFRRGLMPVGDETLLVPPRLTRRTLVGIVGHLTGTPMRRHRRQVPPHGQWDCATTPLVEAQTSVR